MVNFAFYRLVSTSQDFTRSLATEYARVAETLRPEGAVWGLDLIGERFRGKTIFANAFAAAAMEKYADTVYDASMWAGRRQKADYRSDGGKMHIRCGDWRAVDRPFLHKRAKGYGGYDVIENGLQIPDPSVRVDFGDGFAEERNLTFKADPVIGETPAFQALMLRFGGRKDEKTIRMDPA